MASEAVMLSSFRKKLASFMAGNGALAPVKYMAFGEGGHDSQNAAIPPLESQTALKKEILRKELALIRQDDEFSVTGKGAIEPNELVGKYISEAALIDANGELIGIKTFAPKIKEADERYEINIKLRF